MWCRSSRSPATTSSSVSSCLRARSRSLSSWLVWSHFIYHSCSSFNWMVSPILVLRRSRVVSTATCRVLAPQQCSCSATSHGRWPTVVNSSARSSVRGGGTLSSPTVCASGTPASSSSSRQLLEELGVRVMGRWCSGCRCCAGTCRRRSPPGAPPLRIPLSSWTTKNRTLFSRRWQMAAS